MKKKTDKKERRQTASFLVKLIFMLGYAALGLFLLFHPSRLKAFIKGQKREIKELSSGKEDLAEFIGDSKRLLSNLFIPNPNNGHRPIVLRTKNLAIYSGLAILIKIFLVGFLFFAYPTPAQLSAIISENIISLINQERTDAGLQALNGNHYLDISAADKAGDMVSRNYFSHDSPDGKKPWQWIDKSEYDYVYAGENLAMDFRSAESVVSAFMESSSHRKNILNEKYEDIGVAVTQGNLNGNDTTILVVFFGSNRLVSTGQTFGSVSPTVLSGALPGVIGSAYEGKELNLEPGFDNEAVIITSAEGHDKNISDHLIEYSNIIFIAFLIFVVLSLIINILVKIRVQDPSVIFQTIVVIALLASLLFAKFHYLEKIGTSFF